MEKGPDETATRSPGPEEDLLRQVGALLEGHFQLSSGRHSPVFVEKFRLLQYPEATQRLCQLIADRFRGERPEVVAGPTTGGIILSYEVARQLGVRGIFAERSARTGRPARVFQRGFSIGPGERALVVDDVLTTGESVGEVLAAVRESGGDPVGVGVLVDRRDRQGSGQAEFGVPLFACLTLALPTHGPDECPLCAQGRPLTVT